jgi:hypothetical protein
VSSSPACTCCVCPVHAEAGPERGGPVGDGPEWARSAREHLDSVVDWLDGPEATGAGHGELEARLQVHSREQYRLLLQGHLDERARREARRHGVTGSDGISRPRVENGHRRALTSVFGPVTVTRKAYRAVPGATGRPQPDPVPEDTGATEDTTEGTTRTAGNLYPADAVLNLPVGRPSAGLARLAAVEAARGSYGDAREAIERATGVALGKRQVEDLARRAAVDVEAFYAARRPEPCPGRVLGLQCDGKGIVMRPGHLRPGTPPPGSRPGRNTAASGWRGGVKWSV